MKPRIGNDTGFTYVARKQCGCVMGLCVDSADRITAQAVAEFIRAGAYVERVSDAEYREHISQEPTLFKCPHGKGAGRQEKLFP